VTAKEKLQHEVDVMSEREAKAWLGVIERGREAKREADDEWGDFDEWGDLDKMLDGAAADLMRDLNEEERAAGSPPFEREPS
jgi:hypothetical protein